jgi:hypothetical protein
MAAAGNAVLVDLGVSRAVDGDGGRGGREGALLAVVDKIGADDAAREASLVAGVGSEEGSTAFMAACTSDECAICVDTPAAGTQVATLRCGGRYCRGCIEGWWARPGPKLCPTCRACFGGPRGCVMSVVAAAPVETAPPLATSKRPRTSDSSPAADTVRSIYAAPKKRARLWPPREPEKFVVQWILRRRLSLGGALEYHTLWEGYPETEATWEPAGSFAGCPGLLVAFERGLPAAEVALVEPENVVEAWTEVTAGVEIIEPTARRRFEPDNAGWAHMLGRLAAYKAARGDCNVPQGWAEDLRLATWVYSQRRFRRQLDRGEPGQGMTAERAARLTALGFVWDTPVGGSTSDTGWEVQLARLAAYKVAHGDCNVPQGWAEDLQLGSWVANQRKAKKKLDCGKPSHGMTAERAARLTVLGLVWDPPSGAGARTVEMKWAVQLARLAAYKAEHGDCDVPTGWAEDPSLATWVKKQRKQKRKLDRGEPSQGMTVERAARLTVLGLVWERHEAEWEAQLARLMAYRVEHGNCNVPTGWAENPRLGRWVAEQRRLKRRLDRGEPSDGMTAERAVRLTALGLVWDPGAG